LAGAAHAAVSSRPARGHRPHAPPLGCSAGGMVARHNRGGETSRRVASRRAAQRRAEAKCEGNSGQRELFRARPRRALSRGSSAMA